MVLTDFDNSEQALMLTDQTTLKGTTIYYIGVVVRIFYMAPSLWSIWSSRMVEPS